MIKRFYLLLLFIIGFFCINTKSYSLNMEFYDYKYDDSDKNNIKYSRTLKTDTALENAFGSEETMKGVEKTFEAFKYIPGIDVLIKPLAYLIQVGVITSLESVLEGGGDLSIISDVAMIGGAIADVLSPSDTESDAAIAIQQTFGTNLYCKHQKFYIEEEEYVSKQKSTSGGGYSMFPVYPININISVEEGQCNIKEAVEQYFVYGNLGPSESRCSYSYSATSDQCIIELGLPILVAYATEQLVIEGICLGSSISGLKKETKEAAEEAFEETRNKIIEEATDKAIKQKKDELGKELTEKEIKDIEKQVAEEMKDTAEEAGNNASKKVIHEAKKAEYDEIISTSLGAVDMTGATLFFDSRLAFDPIMMYAIIQIELAIDFIFNFPQDIIDHNWVCLAARPAAITALDITVEIIKNSTRLIKYTEAKEAIQNITFCGYDWLSYKKTEDKKYYTRGIFDGSRLKKISDCIVNGLCSEFIVYCDKDNKSYCANDCKDNKCNEQVCEGTTYKSNWCEGITKSSKNIKNKLFREYIYGGKEYKVKEIVEDTIKDNDNRYKAMGYDPNYCIDPRLPEYKGFVSVAQRYYMKGNEKANFACNRFFYNHNDGCVLPEKDVSSEDRQKLSTIIKDFVDKDGDKVEKIYYVIDKSNTEMLNEYVLACKNAFIEARKCCKYRSRHFVCLENKHKESNDKYKFCFSNVVDKYGDPENTSLFSYLSTRDADENKVTCTIDGYDFEASKKTKTDHICVFSDGFCPYNFKLNAGLNYRASYCDANYFSNYKDHSDALKRTTTQYNAADCKEGLFSAKMREEYKKLHSNTSGELLGAYTHYKVKSDVMDHFGYNNNDFTTIYDFEKLVDKDYTGNLSYTDDKGKIINLIKTEYTKDEIGYIKSYGFSRTQSGSDTEKYVLNSLDKGIANQIRTSAYGQVKNFCQYRAHCVEVEKEREYPEDFSISASFLDSSCNGSSQYSRNILQTHNGGVPRQLSVPIVECVYESLKNIVNGVVGMSTCVDGSALNMDGYCDEDTREEVEYNLNQNNSTFFEGRYYKINNNYVVKGTVLPDDYNPFIKLQKYFINIVKTALCLFLVLYSYKKLILVELDILNRKNIMNLIRQVVKFSIIAYLVFSNGWKSGVYNYIVNFSTSAYDFVNRMFLKVVQNPKNQILNLDNPNGIVIKVVKEDIATGKDVDITMCYRYSFFNNIEFSIKDGTICEKGFYSKKLNEMLISKNENFPKQQNNCRLIISNNQEISRLLYYVDEYNKKTTQKLKIKVSAYGDKVTDTSTQCIARTSWDSIDSVDGDLWSEDYDGCYFDITEYPNNKRYISFFDTLDCKMMKYLGYSTNSAVPNMLIYSAIMLLPQFFLPNLGIVSRVVSMLGSIIFWFMLTFLFLMFNVIIKAVYLFASSFFMLSILIFLSPIILPMMLFEKTKRYYDNWFEQVLGTILKPSIGLGLLILYVNLMDIMLIGDDVVFSNHSNIGRGTDVVCHDNAVSFFCLVNRNLGEASEILTLIFNGGLLDLLISVIMAFLFFKLSDSLLDELNGVIGKIFTGIGSTSGLTGINGIYSGGTTDALNKAKSYGKKMEDFRQTYIGDTMTSLTEQALHGSDGVLGRLTIDNAARKVGKGISKMSSSIRTKVNESKLAKNESKLEKLEEFKSLKEEEASLGQRRDELWHKNKETSGNLFLEDEAELEEIDNKLKKLDQLTEEVAGFDEEKIKQSIAREEDRLGIGDGSSGARSIGEKSQAFGEFADKYLRLEKIGNKFASGIFKTKSGIKSGVKNMGTKIGNLKDKIDDKFTETFGPNNKEIAYMEANIKHLEKKNEELDVDGMRAQIERNKTKITELSYSTTFSGDGEDVTQIQKEIEELEKQNKQLEKNIDKTGVPKLEALIELNKAEIAKLSNSKTNEDDENAIHIQEQIDKLEEENKKYTAKINAKKIEFMDNYYTIEKQKREIEKYYAGQNKEDKQV